MDVTVPELSRDEAEEIMRSLALGRCWSGNFLVQGKSGFRFDAHVTDEEREEIRRLLSESNEGDRHG